MTTTITCSRCPATWTGASRAHCAACHRTFSGASAFDLHRSAEGEHGTCLDPAAVGLVDRDGLIGWPTTEQGAAFLARGAAVDGLNGGPEGQGHRGGGLDRSQRRSGGPHRRGTGDRHRQRHPRRGLRGRQGVPAPAHRQGPAPGRGHLRHPQRRRGHRG